MNLREFMAHVGIEPGSHHAEVIARRLAVWQVVQGLDTDECKNLLTAELRDLKGVLDKLRRVDARDPVWCQRVASVDDENRASYNEMEKSTGQQIFPSGYPSIQGKVFLLDRAEYDAVPNWRGTAGWSGLVGVMVLPVDDAVSEEDYRGMLKQGARKLTHIGFGRKEIEDNLPELGQRAFLSPKDLEIAHAYGSSTMLCPE